MTAFIPGGPPRYVHQRRGLQKAITTGGVFALLFDPGTGKTAVVIDYACLLALKSPTGEACVLVIAPLAAVDTWVLQTQKFASPQVSYWVEVLGGSMLQKAEALAARGGNAYKAGKAYSQRRPREPAGHPRARHWEKAEFWAASERDPGVTASEGPGFWVGEPTRPDEMLQLGNVKPRLIIEIINFDPLARRDELGSKNMADVFVDAIKRYAPDFVVIDEAHKIKSAGGQASRLLARVQKYVPRRALLTGTVMPHSPLDVFGQWRFLDPYAFGQKDANGVAQLAKLDDFYTRFAKRGGFYGKEVVGYEHLEDMQRIMARNAVVARKYDCLDLPPTTDVIVPVRLSAPEVKAYAELKKTMATDLASGLHASVSSVLTLGMRLRQITSGHLPTDDHGPMEVLGRSKVDTIKSLVEDQLPDEKRIVIFCLFSFEIKMLAAVLDRSDNEIMVIEGGTPTHVRQAYRQRFGSAESQRMIMVAQIKTVSVAINELVTASHAIFGSLSQQRDDLVQAKARLDRVGQTKPITFWFPMALGTVDEVIFKSHQERTDLEAAMLQHIQQDSQVGMSIGQGTPLAGIGRGDRE